jgi:predicted transcriptional regulator
MKDKGEQEGSNALTGDELVRLLAALSNAHRLRIIAALAKGEAYVSQLARDVGLSRPLVHMHLNKLSAAGLVRSRLELSEEGKAMRFYQVNQFAVALTPQLIVAAAQSLGGPGEPAKEEDA